MASAPHFTCAQPERRGTVAQQVDFKVARDRLSEVEHFDLSWTQISVRPGSGGGRGVFEQQNIATSVTPDSDYGAPSNAHALRVDHGGAQKSCNGAICR